MREFTYAGFGSFTEKRCVFRAKAMVFSAFRTELCAKPASIARSAILQRGTIARDIASADEEFQPDLLKSGIRLKRYFRHSGRGHAPSRDFAVTGESARTTRARSKYTLWERGVG